MNNNEMGKFTMFGFHFLSSKLGLAAMASVTAMVAFNIFAATLQPTTMPGLMPQAGLSSGTLLVTLPARLA
mgnify:CR=1 FL=1